MEPKKTAFVLSGGGTKGAFEAGAIQFLVGVNSIIPDVITATSAGAILAGVLAQARTHEEFQARAREIQEDLLAMTRTELVFGKQPWVAALDGTSVGQAVNAYITERTRPPIPGESLQPITGAEPPTRKRRHLVGAAVRAAPRLPKARKHMKNNGSSVLNLDPLAAAITHGGPSGIKPIDPSLISRPGLQLRLAVTALQAGVLRYVTEDGTIVERDAITPSPGVASGPVDLLEGVLASASVPLVFPPRPLADDVYVDGGVLQNVPVRAAVELGAERIIAVLALPLVQPRDESDFASMNMMGILVRALGAVALADRQLDNLSTELPPGTELTVIDPIVDVVGPFEVELGLLLLDMDYGWLRAADVMADLDDVTQERGGRIHLNDCHRADSGLACGRGALRNARHA